MASMKVKRLLFIAPIHFDFAALNGGVPGEWPLVPELEGPPINENHDRALRSNPFLEIDRDPPQPRIPLAAPPIPEAKMAK